MNDPSAANRRQFGNSFDKTQIKKKFIHLTGKFTSKNTKDEELHMIRIKQKN